VLFEMGEPYALACYCEGRAATREEISEAIQKGLPHLQATAALQGPKALAQVQRELQPFERLLETHLGPGI
jgi:hypothetical protein